MQLTTMIAFALVLTLVLPAQAQGPSGPPNPQVNKIDMSASALTKQDSNYVSVITASLTDMDGKAMISSIVYFNSSNGNLSTADGEVAQGWLNITDNNGKAEAVLTLAALESATVTLRVQGKSASIIVGPQPSTTTVIFEPSAVATTIPPFTPGTPTVTKSTETPMPNVTTPKATITPVANATRRPAAPGFETAITLISLFALYAAITMRRK